MKLVVEVVDAHDLMPKDGEGSASTYVEVDFQNQLSKTKTVPKTLNPVWNQKLVFDLDETKSKYHQSIEVPIYNKRRPIPGRNFLGRVRIPCSNIVKKAALPKAEVASVKTTDAIATQPEKEISALAVIENSTSVAVPESGGITSVKEPNKDRIYKHQVLQLPSLSREKRPQGVSHTMHAASQPAHPSEQDDFTLKDTNPRLGERWPAGGAYGEQDG
ncbi:hypothetical protein GH714_015766 [Hevea brasiliensis]|uniref:C2 domain-containing protein n=1 Tax=Hevea brasiliensis TaxID=3981 RepID=A0A6A6N018_HEVBR|nr:hypothetical protein GH714_015766 [Hevea brasiliensis]